MSKIEEKKKNKQDALLASAFKLFTEKGINNTSISEIVKNAKMRSPRTAGELLEGRDEFCGSLTRKAVRKSFIHILQRPSCHYGIITENQKSCEDSHASHPAPMSAGS